MKIVFIYGEDVVRARKRYSGIISALNKKGWEINYFDKTEGRGVGEAMSLSSLFGNKCVFVYEGANRIARKDLVWIRDNADFDGQLLLYQEGNASAGVLRTLGKLVEGEEFSLPKQIFKYLDALYPGNGARAIRLLRELLENNEPEFILAMMGRHFRDMFWVSCGADGLNYPNWRSDKLRRQGEKFSGEALAKFIDKLSAIDIAAKTGKGELSGSLDFMLASELE